MYQQMQRWIKAQVFESFASDLRAVLRIVDGRNEQPTAAIFDSRTLQSTPESGARAGYDGAKRWKGNKVHLSLPHFHGHLTWRDNAPGGEHDQEEKTTFYSRIQA